MFVFFVVEREESKKNYNWSFWIWLFVVQNGRFVTQNCFSKICSLKPLFYSVLGCALVGQVVTKGKFWTPIKKKRKN